MGQSFSGDQCGTNAADYSTFNPSVTFGSDWIVDAASSMGGSIFSAPTTATAISIADATSDTVDVYYPTVPGLSADVQVNIGGVSAGSFSNGAATGTGRSTFTGTAGSAGITIMNPGSARGYVTGVDARSSAAKGVSVFNIGRSGWTTAQLAASSTGYDALQAVVTVPAQLFILNAGLNDMIQGASQSTSQSNLQAIITALKAKGDVLPVNPNRIDVSQASATVQSNFAAMTAALASSNGIAYLDIATLPNFADYTTANGAGLMGDVVHPSAAGYAAIANGIYGVIAANT